jgi:hypothetical protein
MPGRLKPIKNVAVKNRCQIDKKINGHAGGSAEKSK